MSSTARQVPAGVPTEPHLLSTAAWKEGDELFRNFGHKGGATPKTLVSGDGPSELLIPGTPVSPRRGLHGRSETPTARARARSADAVGRGVFSGSAAEAPPPSRAQARTVVHVDASAPARRLADPSTVESAHARAVAEHGAAAFRLTTGFGGAYMNAGVPLRSVTPLWSAHQRLTALDDTLARMRLASGEDAEGWSAWDAGGEGAAPRPAWSRVGAGTFHFTPLPAAMVPPGTPRANHARGRHSPRVGAGGARADAAASFAAGAADRSAAALLAWEASGPRAAGGGGGGGGGAARHALACALPPPVALLRPSAPAAMLVSRGSRGGVTPRARSSRLDDVLSALSVSRGGGGGGGRSRGSGSVAPPCSPGGSALSTSSLPSPLPATPHEAATRAAAAARARSPGGAPASPGKPPSSARGGGFGSGGASAHYSYLSADEAESAREGQPPPPPPQLQLRLPSREPSPRPSIRSAGTRCTSVGGGASPRLHASEILVGPASARDASGVLRGVTRADVVERVSGLRSPGLVRMRSGEEVLALAALQARATYRLHAHWDVDLTHNFVSAGQWAAMNFKGRTPAPGPAGYAVVAAKETAVEGLLAARSPGALPPGGGRPASRAGFAPAAPAAPAAAQPHPHSPTALGAALQAREATLFGGVAPPPTPLRPRAASSLHSPPPPPPAAPVPAGSEAAAVGPGLAAWESAHSGALNDPEHLPKRELREKVWASGVAAQLGFATRKQLDECGSKPALLSAVKRIPAAKRTAALLEGGRGWATLPSAQELPQSTWSRATFAKQG
jgi:hypothetical protein